AIGSRNAQPGLPSVPALHSYTCAPSACTVSTIVSPGAAMASGSGASAAAGLTSKPDSRSKASVALFGNGIAHFPNLSSLRGAKRRSNPILLYSHGLLRKVRDAIPKEGNTGLA